MLPCLRIWDPLYSKGKLGKAPTIRAISTSDVKFRAKIFTNKSISHCRALLLIPHELEFQLVKQAAKMSPMIFRKMILLHKVLILRGCATHQHATSHHQSSGNITCNPGPLASCLVKAFLRISPAIHLGLNKASEGHFLSAESCFFCFHCRTRGD